MKIGIQSYNYLEDYLDAIRAKGRYAFTVDELKDKFDISDKAIHQNLYRLKAKKKNSSSSSKVLHHTSCRICKTRNVAYKSFY